MFEFLIIAWVAWQFTNLLVQDGVHAVKGTTPPRHTERMARIARGEKVPQRYGIGGYLRDLLDDALRADVERRRRKRHDAADTTDTTPNPDGGQPEDRYGGVEVPDPDSGPAAPAETLKPPSPGRGDEGVDDVPKVDDSPFYTYMDGRRCITKVAGRPNGLCGNPTNTDPQLGGWDSNPHCPAHTRHPSADGSKPADTPTARVYQFPTPPDVPAQPAGDNMPESTTPDGATEVTGLASAVHYAKGVAAAHQSHGSGEAYVASLRGFEVGDGDVALVEAAQEASRNAAAKWQTAADALLNHNAAVREAYQASGGQAGSKQFATSE